MLADRVRMSSYKPSLGVPITIKVEYLDTPPTNYDIAFIPFVSDTPVWTSFYPTIMYAGQPLTYADYQAYTGTPISLMTAHTTPIVVNAIELSTPMISFKIQGGFFSRLVYVHGVLHGFNIVQESNTYGVIFLDTNLVAGDEVVLRLMLNYD